MGFQRTEASEYNNTKSEVQVWEDDTKGRDPIDQEFQGGVED